MKKMIVSLCMAVLYTCQVAAQVKQKVPDWVDLIGISNIPDVNKKQIKDGYYYVLSDEQFNPGTKQAYYHYALTAVSEEGLTQTSQIEFSFDPSYQKGLLHSVRIHRNAYIIDKTNDTEWRELSEEQERSKGLLNGQKTLYANLSDVRKGDIVEYSYSIVGRNPVMKDYFSYTLWLASSVPVGKLFSKIVVPEASEVSLKNINTTLQPEIRKKSRTEYVWELTNPTVIREESSLPSWYTPYPSVQVSNQKTWTEVKVHCREMLQVKETSPNALKPVMDSLVNPAQTEEEKITSLVSFVQGHIRYSGNEKGIYSHKPRHPETVLRNRYGDCKEKSVLLCMLLRRIGLESYPVLVNTGYGSRIKEQNPSVYIFNHCITCFRYKGKLFFVDPTITYQRGDFRNRLIPLYEMGMVLDSSSQAFETIPMNLTNKAKVTEEFRILESGDTELKVVTISQGYAADEMRYAFLTNSLYDIQENYRSFYSKYSEDIDVLDTVSFVDNEEKNEFTITEHYRINGFWKLKEAAGTKSIDKDFTAYSLIYKLNFGNESKRTSPMSHGYPSEHEQEIIVYHANGWNVEDKLKKEDNRFFSYSYSEHAEGECLTLKYYYKSKTDVIYPEQYQDYKSKMDFLNYNMIFNATQKPARDYSGFNWVLLLAMVAGMTVSAILAVTLYRRPYKASYIGQYDSIGGWLVLMGIGVALSPLGLVVSLFREYFNEMSIDYTAFYLDVESDYFSPLKGYYALFSCFVNSGILVFASFMAVLFFQRKASFRLYFLSFRIFNVVFLIVNLAVSYAFANDSDSTDRATLASQTSSLVSFIVTSAIWVPYIWFSERSRFTFTVSQGPIHTEAESKVDRQETQALE